jgi:hypothetical protein
MGIGVLQNKDHQVTAPSSLEKTRSTRVSRWALLVKWEYVSRRERAGSAEEEVCRRFIGYLHDRRN